MRQQANPELPLRSRRQTARRLGAATLAAIVLSLASASITGLEAQQKPTTTATAPINIDWRVLGGLDYEKGTMTDTLRALDGKKVRVPGFIVPLDDADEEGAEFLLVPYYGACVHTPPPPPNQMAFVSMVGDKSVKLALFDAVWMEGTLRITDYDSPYGEVGYQIDGLSMKPYTGK